MVRAVVLLVKERLMAEEELFLVLVLDLRTKTVLGHYLLDIYGV